MRTLFMLLSMLVAPVVAGAGDAAAYVVLKAERPVLRIVDRPGRLTSSAMPAPGAKPVRHSFLTASALAPGEEHELRRILDASSDTADFVAKLRDAGYQVRRE